MSFEESDRPWKLQRCTSPLESHGFDKAPGTTASVTSDDERQDRARLEQEQWQNQSRFRHRMEDIFQRYSIDLGEEADEINIRTGALIVDRGHWKALPDAESEEEYESFTSDEDGIMDDHDEDILDFLQNPARDAPNWLEDSEDNSRAQSPVLWQPEDDLKPLVRLGFEDLPSEETILRQFGSAGPAVLEVLRKQATDCETVPTTPQEDQAMELVPETSVNAEEEDEDDDLSVLSCQSPMTKTPLRLKALREGLQKTILLASSSPTKASPAMSSSTSVTKEPHSVPVLAVGRSTKTSGARMFSRIATSHKSSPLRPSASELPASIQHETRSVGSRHGTAVEKSKAATDLAISRKAEALITFDKALSPVNMKTNRTSVTASEMRSNIERPQVVTKLILAAKETSGSRDIIDQVDDANSHESEGTISDYAASEHEDTGPTPRKRRRKPPRSVNARDYPTGIPERPYYCPLPRCVKKFKSKFGFERHYDAAGAVCKFGLKRVRNRSKKKLHLPPVETTSVNMVKKFDSKMKSMSAVPEDTSNAHSEEAIGTTGTEADGRTASMTTITSPVVERRGESSSPEPSGPLQRKRRQSARQITVVTPKGLLREPVEGQRTTRTSTGTITSLPSYRIKGLREYLKDDFVSVPKTSLKKKKSTATSRPGVAEIQPDTETTHTKSYARSLPDKSWKVKERNITHNDKDETRTIRAWKKRRVPSHREKGRGGTTTTARQDKHELPPTPAGYGYCPPEYPIDQIYAQYVGHVQQNMDYHPQYYHQDQQSGWHSMFNSMQDNRSQHPFTANHMQSKSSTLPTEGLDDRPDLRSEVPDSDMDLGIASSQTELNYWPRDAALVSQGAPASNLQV